MRRQKRARNPLLDKVLIGSVGAARLWGWKCPGSFKRNLPKLRKIAEIRTVSMLKGTFYVLEDLLEARYPNVTQARIQELVKEHQEEKIKRRQGPYKRRQWIGAEEAATILNLASGTILKQRRREFTTIRSMEQNGQTYYDLTHCFRAAFQEIGDEKELDKIIIDYKKQRLQKGLNYDENPGKDQVSKPASKEA